MERTVREEHSKICDQCSALERELDQLRERLNEAEDKVRELEVKIFPGRKHLLEEAVQREADARSAYSEVQHQLEELRRQERVLRMKLRREENGVSPDDIPEIGAIGEVSPMAVEAAPELSASEEQIILPASDEPKEQQEEPAYCTEDHGNFGEDNRDHSRGEDREVQEDLRESEENGEDEDDNLAEKLMEKGKKFLEDNRRDWRVIRGTDVDPSQSLRGEIMEQIREIEEPLRQIRSSLTDVDVMGALQARRDLNDLQPKMIRLVHLVDTIREECPQIRCARVRLPEADGFTLLEDLLARKDDENRISTADELDRFLEQLPKLKQAVKAMPEREGVRDPLG